MKAAAPCSIGKRGMKRRLNPLPGSAILGPMPGSRPVVAVFAAYAMLIVLVCPSIPTPIYVHKDKAVDSQAEGRALARHLAGYRTDRGQADPVFSCVVE